MKTLVAIWILSCSLVSHADVSKAQQDQATFDKAVTLGASGEALRGIGLLKTIEKKNSAGIGQDLIQLTLGRLYFQLGQMDRAIEYFGMVAKSSDFWLVAQEEKGHAYGRKREYHKVISTLMTVTAPVFDGAIGPEPFFVQALTHLKICDYSDVFKTTDLYKKRFKPRAQALQSLIDQGDSEAFQNAMNRLDQGTIDWQTVGSFAKSLPRNFTRDAFIRSQLFARKAAMKDKSKVDAQALGNREPILKRMIELARAELKEIQDTTQKLNIIEAEVIQRIHAMDKNREERPVQGDLARGNSHRLVFPVEEKGEVWLDELDSYEAQVKECPELKLSGQPQKNKRHL